VKIILTSIGKVFKPGPVKALVPGFDQVTRVNSDFFKKSKRSRFSKKNKKSTGCNRVFDRVLPGQSGRWVNQPGHTGFWLFLFFLKPSPVLALGRPGPGSTRRAEPGFKTISIGTLKKRRLS
jgi:hypothetical protein